MRPGLTAGPLSFPDNPVKDIMTMGGMSFMTPRPALVFQGSKRYGRGAFVGPHVSARVRDRLTSEFLDLDSICGAFRVEARQAVATLTRDRSKR